MGAIVSFSLGGSAWYLCKAATGRLHVIKFADDHCRSPGGSYAAGP